MVQIEGDVREKVKNLLKELFQFDNQDLDFGVYRIMNLKRKEIEKFIDEDLIADAEAEFKEFTKTDLQELQKEVEKLQLEIIQDFGLDTIDSNGKVLKNEDAPKVKKYLEKRNGLASAEISQEEIADVFNHIYEFFSRYYSKGDFLSLRRFGGRTKYYLPYNGEEVSLKWATDNQYYIKTGEYFKKYGFKVNEYSIIFVLKIAESDVNNVQGKPRFFLLADKEKMRMDESKRKLEIFFNWRSLSEEEKKKFGSRNVQETIISKIAETLPQEISDKNLSRFLSQKTDKGSLLEQHVRKYVKKNTNDYFIHKRLGEFLENELNHYLLTEVLDIDQATAFDEKRILINKAKISAIRGIAKKIINFISQIETFEKMLFEKKKFILRTDYCITLDLVPETFYEEVGQNKTQVSEWKVLFKLDETTKDTLYSTVGKATLDKSFLKMHKYLVLDTAFFSEDFKLRLLENFENLDQAIGGVIIKSENYQALNILLEKYRGKIACIYIDPPYNTGNDEFIYKDNYQHASWLSLLFDRAKLSREMLTDGGSIFVSCDDNEFSELHLLLSSVYGQNNFIANIIWQKVHTRKNSSKYFSVSHDYIACFARNKSSWKRILLPREDLSAYSNPDNNPKGPWKADPIYANNPYDVDYIITKPNGVQLKPPRGRFWRFSEKKFNEKVRAGDVIWGDGNSYPLVKRYLSEVQQGLVPITFFDRKFAGDNAFAAQEFRDMFGNAGLISYPKPTKLIQRLVQITSSDDDIILDFFAGSGTTGHSVLNLNAADGFQRKYILVEMAGYFEDLLKPRVQKAMYSKEWREGKPTSAEGNSHFFKYIYLEQYEDSLNNIVFKTLDNAIQETLLSYDNYFLRYMLNFETKDSPSRLTITKFCKPFDYKMIIVNGDQQREETVDLVETFNYLIGLTVDKLKGFRDGERLYKTVFGRKNNKRVVIIWRDTDYLDLEHDKSVIEQKILLGNTFDLIYVNGDCQVKNAQPIEPDFKRLMGA